MLLRARDGDSTAWEALVDRFSGVLWAVGRCHCLGKADADDVLQVTWMRLLSHIEGFRRPDRVGAWLVSTARHECLRTLRRGVRPVPGADVEPEWTGPLTPPSESRLAATDRQAAVWDALATMSPPCQRLLRLFMVDPAPTVEQVALPLDMPPARVGPTRGRCLDKLRQRLAAGDREEPC